MTSLSSNSLNVSGSSSREALDLEPGRFAWCIGTILEKTVYLVLFGLPSIPGINTIVGLVAGIFKAIAHCLPSSVIANNTFWRELYEFETSALIVLSTPFLGNWLIASKLFCPLFCGIGDELPSED